MTDAAQNNKDESLTSEQLIARAYAAAAGSAKDARSLNGNDASEAALEEARSFLRQVGSSSVSPEQIVSSTAAKMESEIRQERAASSSSKRPQNQSGAKVSGKSSNLERASQTQKPLRPSTKTSSQYPQPKGKPVFPFEPPPPTGRPATPVERPLRPSRQTVTPAREPASPPQLPGEKSRNARTPEPKEKQKPTGCVTMIVWMIIIFLLLSVLPNLRLFD